MANPIYHADPEFYERPGQTVDLIVDANPAQYVVPALPWRSMGMGETAALVRELRAYRLSTPAPPCQVCGRPTLAPNGLCDYCSRAQARDETHQARARQPSRSGPRLSIRQPWEVWQRDHQRHDPESLDTGHVREYESRIA